MYSADAKKCARQIVKEFFNEILSGEFQIPPQAMMESYLRTNIDYAFDDYQVEKKIEHMNPQWSKEQVSEELERLRMRYENDFRADLIQAAQNAVAEVENLVKSLADTIKAWKVNNLE
ncbi:MAG: hypothetical protein KKH68_02605 [Proteobacteria bacterium]|nr:hypothetical protein [Pseudomonadota bacterium]